MVERELPTNLVWIQEVVSEKPEFMDGQRMTDSGRLRQDWSSTVKVKQS